MTVSRTSTLSNPLRPAPTPAAQDVLNKYLQGGAWGVHVIDIENTWEGELGWPDIPVPTRAPRPVRFVLVSAKNRPGAPVHFSLIRGWYDGDGFIRTSGLRLDDLKVLSMLKGDDDVRP